MICLFPRSRRLMEIADVIEEVPTVCRCGRRAQYNIRYADGKIVKEGAQIMPGSKESYVALCRKRNEQRKSTIVCSQRDPASWKAMILNDEVSANSIMKRATKHYTIKINTR